MGEFDHLNLDALLEIVSQDDPARMRDQADGWWGMAWLFETQLARLAAATQQLAARWDSPAGTRFVEEIGKVQKTLTDAHEKAIGNSGAWVTIGAWAAFTQQDLARLKAERDQAIGKAQADFEAAKQRDADNFNWGWLGLSDLVDDPEEANYDAIRREYDQRARQVMERSNNVYTDQYARNLWWPPPYDGPTDAAQPERFTSSSGDSAAGGGAGAASRRTVAAGPAPTAGPGPGPGEPPPAAVLLPPADGPRLEGGLGPPVVTPVPGPVPVPAPPQVPPPGPPPGGLVPVLPPGPPPVVVKPIGPGAGGGAPPKPPLIPKPPPTPPPVVGARPGATAPPKPPVPQVPGTSSVVGARRPPGVAGPPPVAGPAPTAATGRPAPGAAGSTSRTADPVTGRVAPGPGTVGAPGAAAGRSGAAVASPAPGTTTGRAAGGSGRAPGGGASVGSSGVVGPRPPASVPASAGDKGRRGQRRGEDRTVDAGTGSGQELWQVEHDDVPAVTEPPAAYDPRDEGPGPHVGGGRRS